MIGKTYYKIISSKKVSNFFQMDFEEDKFKITEKGINRFIFFNALFFWASFFFIISNIFGLSYRLIITGLVLSLYMKEKFSPIFLKLFEEIEDIEITERSKPLEDTMKFKIVKDIFNGVDARESLRKNVR